MNKKNLVFMTFCIVLMGANIFAETINQTDTPLFRFTGDQPFAFNFTAEIGARDLVSDNVTASMDKTRFTAGIDVDVMPFIGISVEAGVSQAELDFNNDKVSYVPL